MTTANKSYFTPGPKLLKWITQTHIDLFESTAGAIGGTVFQLGEQGTSLLRPMHVLLLTTTGRKSRAPRKVMLPYFQYDNRIVVIASNAASEKNPDWYVNLVATPKVHIQLGAAKIAATAKPLEGADYVDVWARHTSSWPRWNVYQQQTSRRIPIVEFKPQ